MHHKFAIEYLAFPHHECGCNFTLLADDEAEAENTLRHLLVARARIVAIRDDNAALTTQAFNKMLAAAAGPGASALTSDALAPAMAEIKDRFGFAAGWVCSIRQFSRSSPSLRRPDGIETVWCQS